MEQNNQWFTIPQTFVTVKSFWDENKSLQLSCLKCVHDAGWDKAAATEAALPIVGFFFFLPIVGKELGNHREEHFFCIIPMFKATIRSVL